MIWDVIYSEPKTRAFLAFLTVLTGSTLLLSFFYRVSTLLIVLKHLSNENQRILRELALHPKLLFNYLKSVMNIRSSGLDDAQLELEGDIDSSHQSVPGESSDLGRKVARYGHSEEKDKDHSVLDSQVHLTDLLERSGLEFTVEMAETFVEVGCINFMLALCL